MRPILFLGSILLFILAATPALRAQSLEKIRIKGNFQDEPLSLVLLDLKIRYDLKFDYDQKEIEGIIIDQYLPNLPLREAMTLLLEGTGLGFELAANNRIEIGSKLVPEVPSIAVSTEGPTRYNINISGIVKDKQTGETLPYATVQVHKTTLGTNTNVDGWFSLLKVPSDTVLLLVSYIGYHDALVRLSPETPLDGVNVFLLPSSQVLEAVTVEASKKEQLIQASTGVSKVAIAPAQLAAIPSLGEKDIFRTLQLLPGVSGSNESSSGLFVRGGTPDQNLVLFDGFTVYHVDHLFGFFSAFNSHAIKDVQLYKGGFESKYGGRLSSVVDITGKDGNSEEFNLGGSLSLLSVSGLAEVPFAKGQGTFLVAARRSFQSDFYNDLLNFADGQGETGTEDESEEPAQTAFGPGLGQFNTEPSSWFYDLNVKGTYRVGENVFSLSFYNGQDELDNSRYADENSFQGGPFGGDLDFNFVRDVVDESNWGNTGSSIKWSRKWNDKWYSNALLSYSNYFSNRDRGTYTRIERDTSITELSSGTAESNDLKDFSFKWDWEWQLSMNHKISFGTFGSYLDIEYDYLENDSLTILSRNDQGIVAGGYLQSQSTFFNRLIVTPGIRYSYFDETQEGYWEPRLQLQYLATDRIKIKAATGHYVQFANRVIREDVTQGTRDFWILADGGEVPVSTSNHYIAGISYENNNYLFDVEAYYKTLDDLTEYSTRFVLNGFGPMSSLDFQENFYTGNGIAKGVEFLAQKKSGALTGWISYTLGRVEHQFDIYGEEPFPASHDVTNEVKVVGIYRWGNWSFGGTFIYATGKPYTGPIGAYTIDLLDGNTAEHFALSTRNEYRLPDYHRLDLSASYNIKRIFGGKGQIGASFFNVYNRTNVWYKEYDVIEGDVLETNVNLLGFTPSLYFNWSLR